MEPMDFLLDVMTHYLEQQKAHKDAKARISDLLVSLKDVGVDEKMIDRLQEAIVLLEDVSSSIGFKFGFKLGDLLAKNCE